MRFSLQVGMCDPGHYLPMAKTAEEAGTEKLEADKSLDESIGMLQWYAGQCIKDGYGR